MTDYDSINALNWSTLKHMDVTPAFARYRYDHPDETDDTAAYVSGRAIHCATLEPKRFPFAYVVEPDFAQIARDKYGNLRTKASRQYRDKLADEWNTNTPRDAELITQVDYDMAIRCAEKIHSDDNAMKYLDGAQFESVVTWEQSRIKCKGRIDALTDRVIDLKTTRRNTIDEIERDAATFNYHAQLAWYHDGAVRAGLISEEKFPCAIFIHASHKSEFVDIAILNMVGETLEFGRRKYQKLLDKFIACNVTGWWPGMAEMPVQWVLPDWKVRDEDE